jgi:hypothetical protein
MFACHGAPTGPAYKRDENVLGRGIREMKNLQIAVAALFAGAVFAGAESSARAEPGVLLGTQFALAGGAWFPPSRGPFDLDRGRGGLSRLPAAGPDAMVRFGLTGLDFTLDIHLGGFDSRLPGPGKTGTYHRKDIGADFGRSFALGHDFRLAPFVEVGTVESTFCLHAVCASQNPVVVGLGLALPWTIWSTKPPAGADPIVPISRLSLGPKLSYAIDVDPSRGWSVAPEGGTTGETHARGTVGPSGGGYVGVEARYLFGIGRRAR